MKLGGIFEWLQRTGLAATHTAFSIDWLNMGPRYFDYILCSRRPPAIRALVALHVRLRVIADDAVRFASRSDRAELDDLAQQVWLELQCRCCALLPDKRHRPAPIRATQRTQIRTGQSVP